MCLKCPKLDPLEADEEELSEHEKDIKKLLEAVCDWKQKQVEAQQICQ
jgi:DNA-binding HxlR family transcriptional regulator